MIITGSLECHGVHNPLGVDTLVPEALAQRIEKPVSYTHLDSRWPAD